MSKNKNKLLKLVIGFIATAAILLLLNHMIGYERSELLAFALLIGISLASMK